MAATGVGTVSFDGRTLALSSGSGDGLPPGEPPALVGFRYALEEPLGRGGFGTVWRARDLLRQDHEVAVKLVSALSEAQRRHVRRELVALRRARLPGMVVYLDDGPHGSQHFIVLELVQGRPFPGRGGPLPWAALAPLACRLVEIVAGLHDLGLVHRDLKPGNVLVRGEQDLVVLDLGLAVGAEGLRYRDEDFGATAEYAPPELLDRAAPAVATDLYAIGAMLHEALVGEVPLRGGSRLETLQRRRTEAPPPLPAALPAPVAEVVRALLDPDPSRRPASAWEVLSALGGASPDPLGSVALPGDDERPASPEDLYALFHGPDAFLHLREDAARALWARTGGRPAAVRRELGAWRRGGIGAWDGARLRLTRPELERLAQGERVDGTAEPVDPVERAFALAFPDGDAAVVARALGRDIAAEVERLVGLGRLWRLPGGGIGVCPVRGGPGDRALQQALADALPAGHPGRVRLLADAGAAAARLAAAALAVAEDPRWPPGVAISVLRTALLEARAEPAPEVEARLLLALAGHALRSEASAELSLALNELQRAEARHPELEPAEQLLRGTLAVLAGNVAAARQQVEGLSPLATEGLECFRVALEWWTRRGTPDEEPFLEGLEAWAAEQPDRAGRLAGWWGNLRYRQGRMAEAAALHRGAAAQRQHVEGRLGCLRNAVAALLETDALEEATRLAGEAAQLAAEHRLATLEALSTWAWRAAACRAGRPLRPEPALIEAGVAVSARVGAQLAIGEAVIAWRAGSPAVAAALAGQARPHLVGAAWAPARVLADLLLLLGRDAPPEPAEIEELAGRARALQVVGLRLQVLGLLGQQPGGEALLAETRQLVAAMPPAERARPLELLRPRDLL